MYTLIMTQSEMCLQISTSHIHVVSVDHEYYVMNKCVYIHTCVNSASCMQYSDGTGDLPCRLSLPI